MLKLHGNKHDFTQKLEKRMKIKGNNEWVGRTFRKFDDPQIKFLFINNAQKSFSILKKQDDEFSHLDYVMKEKFASNKDLIMDHQIDGSADLIFLTLNGNLIKENFKISDLAKKSVKAKERQTIDLKDSEISGEEFVSLAICPKSHYLAVNSRAETTHTNSRILLLSNQTKQIKVLNSVDLRNKKIRFFQAFNFGDYIGGEDSLLLFGFTSSLRSKLACFLIEGESLEFQRMIDVHARYPSRLIRLEKSEKEPDGVCRMMTSDQKGRIFTLRYE